jgi:hypothetical protein
VFGADDVLANRFDDVHCGAGNRLSGFPRPVGMSAGDPSGAGPVNPGLPVTGGVSYTSCKREPRVRSYAAGRQTLQAR